MRTGVRGRKAAEGSLSGVSSSVTSLALTVGSILVLSFLAGRTCRSILISQVLQPGLRSEPSLSPEQLDQKIEWGVDTIPEREVHVRQVEFEEEEDSEDDEEDDEGRQCKGDPQQLLVDLENLDGYFLNSEKRIVDAVLAYLSQSDFNWKTEEFHHRCQETLLHGGGLSCAFSVGNGGRITLYTWPIGGFASLEFFISCSENPLDLDLGLIEELFAVPRPRNAVGIPPEQPYLRWALKSRGFFESSSNPEAIDANVNFVGVLEHAFKKRVASVQTEFQQIDIFDMIHPRSGSIDSYLKMLRDPTSYEGQNPDMFRLDRLIFLDGVLQSRFYGEAAYHEALVHPAMLTHPNPRRVAIVGGGEGATLREVLKHKTVETVTMIEIDKEMVDVSREYIPEWSDCSSLLGSADSCFDDPRTELFFEDAVSWFIKRYLKKPGSSKRSPEPYDVIIMDALDPDSVVEFSDLLYDNVAFVKSLSLALTDEGVMVIQSGIADSNDEIPTEYMSSKQYGSAMLQHMKNNGFVNHKSYEEASGGFLDPWSFTIAYKSKSAEVRLYSNEAQINLELRKRAMPTVSNDTSPFRYFDGATMMSYQYTSRNSADASCLQGTGPCRAGRLFSSDLGHVPSASLAVNRSSAGSFTVVSKVDIPNGSFVGVDAGVQAIECPPLTSALLGHFSKGELAHTSPKAVLNFVTGVGVPLCFHGGKTWFVDTSIVHFMKNSCEGVSNLGKSYGDGPSCPYNSAVPSYNNTDERDEYAFWVSSSLVAATNIAAGSELLASRFCAP